MPMSSLSAGFSKAGDRRAPPHMYIYIYIYTFIHVYVCTYDIHIILTYVKVVCFIISIIIRSSSTSRINIIIVILLMTVVPPVGISGCRLWARGRSRAAETGDCREKKGLYGDLTIDSPTIIYKQPSNFNNNNNSSSSSSSDDDDDDIEFHPLA